MAKWSEDTTVKFIEEYIKRECLWNIRSPNYRNKQAKQQGISDIVLAMAIPNFGIKEAESKIKSIRSTYSQELKKIKDSTRSGSGTDDIYKPSIKWFDILHQALNSVNISESRKTQSNLENNEENNIERSTGQTTDDEITEIRQPTPVISEQHLSTPNANNAASRKRRLRDLHSLVDKVGSISNNLPTVSDNEFDQFGKSIAGQLKAMPLLLALQAQKFIQNYMSDLRIQQLLNTGRTRQETYHDSHVSMNSGITTSSLYSNSSLSPSPSTNTYYAESPEGSPWIRQNPQNAFDAGRATNPQSVTENTVTMYSLDDNVTQDRPDILSQAIASIIQDTEK